MSSCNVVLGGPITDCLTYADKTDECLEGYDDGKKECTKAEDQGKKECTEEEDQGKKECSQKEDHGKEECSQKEDQGYKDCCDWWPCSSLCKAWTWVSNIVCVAWTWVQNLVCVAWTWVANIVCVVWTWVSHVVCVVWNWISKWICVVWKWILKVICTVIGWIITVVCAIATWAFCLGKSLWSMTPFADAGPPSPIKKLFVLAMENRSYDHMLGFANLAGPDPVTGAPAKANDFFTDVGPKDLSAAPFINRKVKGDVVVTSKGAPFMLEEDDGPPHDFQHIIVQAAGFHDAAGVWQEPNLEGVKNKYPDWHGEGFVRIAEVDGCPHPELVMKAFEKGEVPVLAGLAAEYAVCDNWFSSLPGPTWPNRMFMHAATSGGLHTSPGAPTVAGSAVLSGFRFENGTIFDALDDKCVDWRIFEGDEFPQVWALDGMNLNAAKGRFTDMHEFEEAVADPGFRPQYVFIEPAYGNFVSGTYHCGNSQHPCDDVTRGEALIKRVYDAIRRSPHWESSALVITYDEHGGFFDHVEPPIAPPPGDKNTSQSEGGFIAPFADGTNSDFGFKFDRFGVRVPAVVISPLIPKGTVDHTRYDHSSIVKTVGAMFGFGPLTDRDAEAQDFLKLFSLKTPRKDTPVTAPDPVDSGISCLPINPFDNTQNLSGDVVELLLRGVDAVTGLGADDSRGDGTQLGTVSSGLSSNPAVGSTTAKDMPDNFWGFMHIALRRAHATARSSTERRRLIKAFELVRTETDARRFLLAARLIVGRRRKRPLTYEGYRPDRTPPAAGPVPERPVTKGKP